MLCLGCSGSSGVWCFLHADAERALQPTSYQRVSWPFFICFNDGGEPMEANAPMKLRRGRFGRTGQWVEVLAAVTFGRAYWHEESA